MGQAPDLTGSRWAAVTRTSIRWRIAAGQASSKASGVDCSGGTSSAKNSSTGRGCAASTLMCSDLSMSPRPFWIERPGPTSTTKAARVLLPLPFCQGIHPATGVSPRLGQTQVQWFLLDEAVLLHLHL